MRTKSKKDWLKNKREKEKCRIDDFCAEHKIETRQMSEYQIRLNEMMDVYPTSKKYCMFFKRGSRWGKYENLEELLAILKQ